jgi:hypothetical protein
VVANKVMASNECEVKIIDLAMWIVHSLKTTHIMAIWMAYSLLPFNRQLCGSRRLVHGHKWRRESVTRQHHGRKIDGMHANDDSSWWLLHMEQWRGMFLRRWRRADEMILVESWEMAVGVMARRSSWSMKMNRRWWCYVLCDGCGVGCWKNG